MITLASIIGEDSVKMLGKGAAQVIEAGGYLYIQPANTATIVIKIGFGSSPYSENSYLLNVAVYRKRVGCRESGLIDEARFYFEQYLGSTVKYMVVSEKKDTTVRKWRSVKDGVQSDCSRPNFSPLIDSILDYITFWTT